MTLKRVIACISISRSAKQKQKREWTRHQCFLQFSRLPRRHVASFGDIREDEIEDLARVLRLVLRNMYFGLNDPDLNYTIITAPAEAASAKYCHWYLSIVPRITEVAGFEMGSGTFINTVLPEAAAEFLRNIEVEKELPVAS